MTATKTALWWIAINTFKLRCLHFNPKSEKGLYSRIQSAPIAMITVSNLHPTFRLKESHFVKCYLAHLSFLIVALVAAIPSGASAEPVLEKGDRLAIVGDSITEQKLYSKFIETYLLACYPELQIQTFQFGWGGERAPGFASRMENDLVPWKPDVVTTCYGMNDGSYRAYTEQIGSAYESGMRQIIDRMKRSGAIVVVGSPGVVDSFTWAQNRPEFDRVYNENLEQLGQIAQQLAQENKFPHADVFGAMHQAMVAAKSKLGEEYPVAGRDGVHPGPNGHLVMAYAFLKALGLEGEIGQVTIDVASDTATASEGHKVLGGEDGEFQLQSSRYPFCFLGDSKDPNGTASILPFVPFNHDLNRFVLKVNGLQETHADVTFGSVTKTFTKEQLTQGINLAAEFIDNPFVEPFNRVLNEVAEKQAAETSMIKGFITNFRRLSDPLAEDPEVQAALRTLRRKMMEANSAAHEKARAAVQPVKYTLAVKPTDASSANESDSEAERFVELYNGRDLTGWVTTGNWLPQEDGSLLIQPRAGEKGWTRYDAYLWSPKKYKDFILDVEYAYPPGGNSGVYFRVADRNDPVEKGIEAQILDSSSKQGKLGPHDHGGIVKTAAPTKNMSRPPHEWNRMVVTCIGSQLQVELNGEKIIDVQLDEGPMKDRPMEGYIGFQDHGRPNDIRFRNIRIREINSAAE